MAEKDQNLKNTTKCCGILGIGPFILGLALFAAFGWFIYPKAMMEEQKQPIAFNHVIHVESVGMSCEDCHYLRADGTFSGVSTTEACAECHVDPVTDVPEEAYFIAEYVNKGVEIKDKWLIYQKQPDNVFFSHAAHNFETCTQCHEELYETPQDLCNQCHIDVASTTKPPAYFENRLSGYSKDTMMMSSCEACHANPGHYDGLTRASNACFVCHK